jgi:hypothetical protein
MSADATAILEQARAEVAQDEKLHEATGELVDGIREMVRRYVAMPGEHELLAAALFVLHTWTLPAADATPYLVVVSETPRCGKTRLLEVLRLLVRNPWHVASVTEAALFRKIEAEQPTLLLDEVDAVFAHSREGLRAVLNAGNRRGSSVTRMEAKEVREFPVFCAKVLAGIDTGTLPDTIRDRSIVLRMRRKDGEPVKRLRSRVAEREAWPLATTLAMWARAAQPLLEAAEPEIPEALGDRMADAWEPLLAIGSLAGPEWLRRTEAAAIALSGSPEEIPVDPDVLLGSVRAAREEQA